MTREEAIEVLNTYDMSEDNDDTEFKSAIALAIKALEQEPCDDVISRQAAIRIAEQGQVQGYEWQFKELVKLPPVRPQEQTGHWIYELEDWNKWTCSECGWSKRTDVHVRLGYDFCPSCGARMVEPQESERINADSN